MAEFNVEKRTLDQEYKINMKIRYQESMSEVINKVDGVNISWGTVGRYYILVQVAKLLDPETVLLNIQAELIKEFT